MKLQYKICILFALTLVFAACSRKKSTFLTRTNHSVSSKFNTLFNGGVALESGREQLAFGYRDNFWEILPVERLEVEEDNSLPGTSKNPNFNRAEEKATKAIQKHGMYFDGKEHNPQMDEAYMMLGKARYFDGRFIPAQDAFNFILDRYPTSNNINQAKVWKAKSNIRLKNEEVALENLQKMLDDDVLEDEDRVDASAIMAQAYINLDSIAEALPYMKYAAEEVKDKELQGRYLFIKGQLYNRLGEKDSANISFDEVIDLNRKAPRGYMINAYLEKGKNFDYDKGDKLAFLELLQELEENRENRPFLDKIYNQYGDYYLNSDSTATAVQYYNKSIKSYREDRVLQGVNYQALAEINFDGAEYKNAGAYYDSTLVYLEVDSRQYRRVKKRRENLKDVIKYEDIASINDSVLKIVNMSESEQLSYFTDYTQKLRAKAIADSIANIVENEAIANKEFYEKKPTESGPKGGTFYFYNSTTIAYGKQEFKKTFGDRKLEDNWRLSSKQNGFQSIDDETAQVAPIAENELYKPQTYIDRIPKDKKVIDSLATDRNFAYYQLGLIYKEKFKEYELGANRLEKLLTYNPEERLIVPAKYNLVKIYDILNQPDQVAKYKQDILSNYPDSRYAEILLNPNSQLATDESSPEYKYNQLYKEFEASKYQNVIDKSEQYIATYNGNDIVPKFELLKATAVGKQQGFEAYKKALNFVSLNYPSTDEGKQAQVIYATVLPGIEGKEFTPEASSKKYKLIYQFTSAEAEQAIALQEKIDKAITDYNYSNMSTSIDYYNTSSIFVVIHGLNTKLGAKGFGDILKENKKYKIVKPFFEISSDNYRTIQIHKNLPEYMDFETLNTPEVKPQK